MIAAALALLLAVQDDAARAKQMLEEAATVLRKNKRLVIEVERKTDSGGDGESVPPMKSKIAVALPNLVRAEASQGDSSWLSVHDGSHYWYLDVKKNEYAQYPPPKRPLYEMVPGQLFFGESAGNILGSEIKVSKHKDGYAISWLLKGRGKPRKRWLWLSKDNIPLSYSEEGEYEDGRTWERTDDYKIDLDPKLDEKTFEFVPPAGATLQPPPKAEPAPARAKATLPKEAVEILTKAVAALRSGPALSYEGEISYTGPYAKTWKVKVVAQRPDRFRVEQAGIQIVCDGTTCWYYDGSTKKYTKYEPRQMPSAVAEKIAGLYLDEKPESALGNAADVEVSREKGIDIITWIDDQNPATRYELKIDSKTGFPVEMSHETTRNGDTYGGVRKYGAFDVSKVAAAEAFTFTPPEGSSERTAADDDWEAQLVPVGSAAPELKGKDAAGKDISLSDFKGKPVLAVFGPPGTPDLRWLQVVHEAYAKRGLVVLAVMREEGAAWIRSRMESEKFAFSVVCLKDDFIGGPFGVRVIPTLYVIGADGKVADRMVKVEWFGYKDQNLRAALEKALKVK